MPSPSPSPSLPPLAETQQCQRPEQLHPKPNMTVATVPTSFPHTPYRAQNALMHAVVTAVKNSTHALVESPTGTGKSLALLCSSLAVQAFLRRQHERKVRQASEDHPLPPASVDTSDAASTREKTELVAQEGQEDQKEQEPEAVDVDADDCAHASHEKPCGCAREEKENAAEEKESAAEKENAAEEKENAAEADQLHPHYHNPVDSSDDDFQPRCNFRDVSWQRPTSVPRNHALPTRKRPHQTQLPENAFMLNRPDAPLDASSNDKHDEDCDDDDDNDDDDRNADKESKRPKPKKPVPRIFYATRTHNQLTHVVHELRKTAYVPRMAILASRREYCLRPDVRANPNRDDVCKHLIAEHGCDLFHGATALAAHPDVVDNVLDIEDLATLAESQAACPYYASHDLYKSADLILCPYSFLLDPVVRSARGINLRDDVVILDEAHNIDDYARQAASFAADVATLRQGVSDVNTTLITSERRSDAPRDLLLAYRTLMHVVEAMLSLVERADVDGDFRADAAGGGAGCGERAMYERRDMLTRLLAVGVTPDAVLRCRTAQRVIANFGDGDATDAKRLRLMAERIVLQPERGGADDDDDDNPTSRTDATNAGYGYGYGEEVVADTDAGADDETDPLPPQLANGRRGRGRNSRNGRSSRAIGKKIRDRPPLTKFAAVAGSLVSTLDLLFDTPDVYLLCFERRVEKFETTSSLSLHCLHAATSFRHVSSVARSVIVTSGTLAPMAAFASELGTRFAIEKSLPHVIDVSKQLFVAAVNTGPSSVQLDCSFRGAARFEVQDSLGAAIADYVAAIPAGVLVFMPSYRMLRQLEERWRASGVWQRLCQLKDVVLVEPSQRGDEFDGVVMRYEEACVEEGSRGAVLFGVCRGKLSEGVDFRDGTARAVILVGIPYPYAGDIVVSHKRLWNDRARQENGQHDVQSGSQWYEMQAFRALNQALGRSVRHRYDYGAILLLDYRFRHTGMLKQLPAWTRQSVSMERKDHAATVRELEQFYSTVQLKIASIVADDKRYRRPPV